MFMSTMSSSKGPASSIEFTVGIGRARALWQWLTTLAAHLVLSVVFFPTYLLTFHASGGYYGTIYDIAVGLPTYDAKLGHGVRADSKDMYDEVTTQCRKARIASLFALILCVATFQLGFASQVGVQLLLLVIALNSIQGFWLSYSVENFVELVTRLKNHWYSPIHHWTTRQRKIASTLLAIPDAFILGYNMLAGIVVLFYYCNPSAIPTLHEKLGQPQAFLLSVLVGVAIIAFQIIAVQLAIAQCTPSSLLDIEVDDDQLPKEPPPLLLDADHSSLPATKRV